MNTKTTFVEIIDFKEFPKKMKYGAIGMVFGKVTNGLTTNFFSELYYPFQLDENGIPEITVQSALGAINYCLSDEIMGALVFLQGQNWFDENVTRNDSDQPL